MTDARAQTYRGALVERAVFGVYRATADGRFLDVNPALVRMLGYESATELLSTNMRDVYADSKERERVIQAHRGRDWFEGVEVTWRRKDGQLLTVRLTGRIITDQESELLEAIVEDVTGQRQWDSAARDADRLRAIGQLAGGIAHEFNNLLSVIIGHSELLLDGLTPPSPAFESVHEIQAASGKAAALTRQLMAFARRQPLRPQPVDVSGVLTRLQPAIHSSLRSGVVVETRSADDRIIVEVDSVQLEQVILGLVGNGSDAMPDGGRLTIAVEEVELSAGAFGPGIDVAPGRFGLITVEDTGVGMDEATRSRIFEPFFSTKPFGRGTGLGLAVVYGIVKQHGGFIFVDSEVGRGTRFRLYFRSAKPSTMNETPNRELGATRQTVLVVDDLEGIRRLIARTLRQHRYVVREASNGLDALKIARTENVSLVITDANMPEMDGRELARRVIEQVPDIRVLIISGRVEDAGSFAFLAKPFSRSELLRRVAELLAEQRPGGRLTC